MWKKFICLGVTEEQDAYTQSKITLSNQITFFLFLIDSFYGVLSYFRHPQLTGAYIAGLVGVGSILLAMRMGGHLLARMMTSVLPLCIGGYNYLALSKNSQNDMVNTALVAFSLAIVPFILFEARERIYRNISFLICAALIVSYPSIRDMIDIEVLPRQQTQRNIFFYVNLSMSVTILFILLSVLQRSSKRSEDQSQQLMREMKQQNEEVREKTQILENTLQEVEKARQDEERRTWVANGIAQISVILRQEEDVQLLYDKLIAAIVKYLGANQGGLYIVQGASEKYIELVSLYAYDKKKFVDQRIEPGQGLVGQCYMEKDKILLTEVPADYIRITSGLGEATPRFVCLIPLMVRDEVEGILELASFTLLEEHTIVFLDKLGEAIASTLRNLNVNQHTRLMLEASRQQAEEMRAQEEELRQNLEELEATQENQRRLQEELQEKLDVTRQQEHTLQQVMAQLAEARQELEQLKEKPTRPE